MIMKRTSPNYTAKCLKFAKHFKGRQGVTTHQIEYEDAHYFSGTAYVDGYEFVCIDQLEEKKYMVYINDPVGYDELQLVFGYYKTFRGALKKASAIVDKRQYPEPVEIW
nr:MAG TPA: hypothetical protein [Bacteriophage sp.]